MQIAVEAFVNESGKGKGLTSRRTLVVIRIFTAEE